jgi:hypothetical protein
MRGLLALALCATPALADAPLTVEAFEAHVTGHTLTYQQYGQLYGIEEYLPDRKVRWSVAPNTCQYGSWYPEDEYICFVYEYDPNPSCWTFRLSAGRLVALSIADAPGAELHETERSQTPLPCPGPEVGA